MKVFLVSIVLIGIAFIGLGLNILFRKNGKFPETEIGHNKHMKRLGITCVKCEETKKIRKRLIIERQVIKASELKLDLK
jgi:hypothetical protein